MKIIHAIIFTLLSPAAVSQPEWRVLFPDQSAVVDGHEIGPSKGLVVKTIAGETYTEVLNLSELTGFDIPDNVAVTGFTVKNTDGPSFRALSYLFSLSASVENVLSGDVIECGYDGCMIELLAPENSNVSALDYNVNTDELWVSYDTGFDFNNGDGYAFPAKVYQANDFLNDFDALFDDMGFNNSITAFDSSNGHISVSPLIGFSILGEVIKPATVFSETLSLNDSIVDELSDEVTGINAYYAVDSGWAEFEDTVIEIAEDAGSIGFDVLRMAGAEGRMSAVVVGVSGTAVAGVDFQNFASQYNWINGDTQVFTNQNIAVIDNDVIDGDRTFTISLRDASSDYTLSVINPEMDTITVNIIDDDDRIFADGFE